MRSQDAYKSLSDGDLCEYLKKVGDEYGVRIRVSLIPLARSSGKSSHAVLAAAYYTTGKRIHDVASEQCLFPGDTSKTFAGAAFYVATQLVQTLDTWYYRKKREEEQREGWTGSPLEDYIAGSFES